MIEDLSADIVKSQNLHSQQVADLMMDFGLMDLLLLFWHRLRYLHMMMWHQVRQIRVMRSRIDYILEKDRCRFEMVGIRGISKYPSDNLILWAWLLCPTKECHHFDAWVIPAQMVNVHGFGENNRN